MKKRVTGHLRKRGKKNIYYLRYVIDGKAFEISTGETDKKKAQTFTRDHLAGFNLTRRGENLKAVEAQIADVQTKIARAEEKANPPPEISKLWDRFLESPIRPDSGPSTLKQYQAEWNRFVAWLNENHEKVKDLRQVTPKMARDYAGHLISEKVSASTFNQHRNFLKMMWRVMDEECRLTENPWEKIQRRKLESLKNRKRALTTGQFESLLAKAEATPDLRDLFLILAWTGLRLADAVLLKWGNVDFTQNILIVVPQKTSRRQGKQIHIPIFPAALEVLNQRQEGKVLNPNGMVFSKLARLYKKDNSALSKKITDIFDKAGIETTEERADRERAVVVYGAHSLRHFFVTAASSAGMPAAMIKSITGHATDEMLEHYQHIGKELAAEMAARVTGKKDDPKTITEGDTPKDLESFKKRVAEIAKGMTEKNCETAKAELLELVA